MMAMNTRVKCSSVFTHHNWQLAQAISEPGPMAADFNENDIIPSEVKERAVLNTTPPIERAIQLLTSVSKAIRADVNSPEMFLKVISVLKRHSETKEIALSMYREYYGEDKFRERRTVEGIGGRGSGDDVTDNGPEETHPHVSYQVTPLPRPPQDDSVATLNENDLRRRGIRMNEGVGMTSQDDNYDCSSISDSKNSAIATNTGSKGIAVNVTGSNSTVHVNQSPEEKPTPSVTAKDTANELSKEPVKLLGYLEFPVGLLYQLIQYLKKKTAATMLVIVVVLLGVCLMAAVAYSHYWQT